MLSRIAIISGSVAAAWEAMARRSIVWIINPVTPKYKVKAMMIVPTIRWIGRMPLKLGLLGRGLSVDEVRSTESESRVDELVAEKAAGSEAMQCCSLGDL